ncbi:phosphate propanoyltransferase [Salimicrobium album]|uniref:Phosphate propanoyltransferase n=1 Tax=Salimicrobium album TaxID=50717 RepID=A0A1H3FTN2_9BACI|nr:phosphate propanoyltransferase [Salimicrobium album]SDX94356.1 putative phosphotransacetylase [Salimicrobium album]
MEKADMETIVEEVMAKLERRSSGGVPIGISARHCHLDRSTLQTLFGEGYELSKKAELSQPGQFAANETVTIAGPKGTIPNVRILGPLRPVSQVEVSRTDAFKLGGTPPVRLSGDIGDSAPVTLIGPKGSIYLKEGLIIAKAHIHMHPDDATFYNVTNGEEVDVKVRGEGRTLTFSEVVIRVSDKYRLDMHVDTDEANAAALHKNSEVSLIKADKDG